jgi:1-acyl-sn-glycerol-3-phosphate acyltransferase
MTPTASDVRNFPAHPASQLALKKGLPLAGRDSNVEPCAWSCGLPARIVRRICLVLFILPFIRIFTRIRADGLESLDGLHGPLIFAVSHQSEFDTLVLLASLPPRWRHRVAVTMCDWIFGGTWFGERAWERIAYLARVLFFNGFTLPRSAVGLRRSMKHAAELAKRGWSLLIYPEGTHTTSLLPFEPGVALFAARLNLPVVPIRLHGMDRVLPPGAIVPRRGSVSVHFGAPLWLNGSDYKASAVRLEQAVRGL